MVFKLIKQIIFSTKSKVVKKNQEKATILASKVKTHGFTPYKTVLEIEK